MRGREEGEEGGRDFISTSHTAAESVSSNQEKEERETNEKVNIDCC